MIMDIENSIENKLIQLSIYQKSLLKIVYEEIKWNFPSKILANDVYLSKKFNWSKEKLKKCMAKHIEIV